MAKIKLEDGTEIEAFTQEEVDAQLKTKEEEIGKTSRENQKKVQDELDELKKDPRLVEKKEDKKEGEGEGDEKDEKIKELQDQLQKINERIDGDVKNELLEKLSGGDADIKAKIEHEYGQFANEVSTKEDIQERLLKSVKLALPEEAPSTLSDALGFANSRTAKVDEGAAAQGPIEDSTIEQGKKFGISEEDYKKYGDQVEAPVTDNN